MDDLEELYRVTLSESHPAALMAIFKLGFAAGVKSTLPPEPEKKPEPPTEPTPKDDVKAAVIVPVPAKDAPHKGK